MVYTIFFMNIETEKNAPRDQLISNPNAFKSIDRN
jgi:hypothetical protein